MEFDVYLPELSLGLEYQGEQHFTPIHWIIDISAQLQRDQEKQHACKQVKPSNLKLNLKAGITLVEVPYWWNFSVESLATTIQITRPEIIHI